MACRTIQPSQCKRHEPIQQVSPQRAGRSRHLLALETPAHSLPAPPLGQRIGRYRGVPLQPRHQCSHAARCHEGVGKQHQGSQLQHELHEGEVHHASQRKPQRVEQQQLALRLILAIHPPESLLHPRRCQRQPAESARQQYRERTEHRHHQSAVRCHLGNQGPQQQPQHDHQPQPRIHGAAQPAYHRAALLHTRHGRHRQVPPRRPHQLRA